MQVDLQALDWGTVGSRRASKAPPDKGGWHIFFTWSAGAGCLIPAGYNALNANGDKAWFGWPNSPEIQQHISEWYDAPNEAAAMQAIQDINRSSLEYVTWIITGFFLTNTAWRKNVQGIQQGPFPNFWGVQKT